MSLAAFIQKFHFVHNRAPVGVSKVVSLLLKRDPSERITADTATLMLALVLWAPAEWLQDRTVTVAELDR